MSNWSPASGKSPLGLPLPKTVGRQHIPDVTEIAAEQGVTRDRGGEEVRHVCWECGGNLASGLILVQVCPVCRGVGTLSDDDMDRIGAGRLVLP